MANEIFSIRVRNEYPWDTAQVGGQRFNKRETLLRHARDLSEEIRNSPILEITPVDTVTPAAPIAAEMPAPNDPEQSDTHTAQSKRAGRKAG